MRRKVSEKLAIGEIYRYVRNRKDDVVGKRQGTDQQHWSNFQHFVGHSIKRFHILEGQGRDGQAQLPGLLHQPPNSDETLGVLVEILDAHGEDTIDVHRARETLLQNLVIVLHVIDILFKYIILQQFGYFAAKLLAVCLCTIWFRTVTSVIVTSDASFQQI